MGRSTLGERENPAWKVISVRALPSYSQRGIQFPVPGAVEPCGYGSMCDSVISRPTWLSRLPCLSFTEWRLGKGGRFTASILSHLLLSQEGKQNQPTDQPTNGLGTNGCCTLKSINPLPGRAMRIIYKMNLFNSALPALKRTSGWLSDSQRWRCWVSLSCFPSLVGISFFFSL